MSAYETTLAMVVASNWPTPLLMILSFPLLLLVLLLFVHVVVEFTPRSLRAHHVSYHPFKTRMIDLWLIIRLLASELKSAGDWVGEWLGLRGKARQN
ncbi:MAG: hypothetical protein M3463_01490 [Verrucomicrobiota bacterium]|nr:hypothetical protein [Verrucomicrobiota bacterium]